MYRMMSCREIAVDSREVREKMDNNGFISYYGNIYFILCWLLEMG